MGEISPIFLAAATWAAGRSFGDPAGIAIRAVLSELTGLVRIGMCTVDAAVDIEIPNALIVQTFWPAVGSGTDVVLLLHAGVLPGRVRSRMQAGPQHFVHVKNVEQAKNFVLSPAELGVIRSRLLNGELRALATRFPEIMELIEESEKAESKPIRVAVIGPDPERLRPIKTELHQFAVVDSIDADVVVAVAGPYGFKRADAPIIEDAWKNVGRLIVTSPLPEGVCSQAVFPGFDLAATVDRLARQPARMNAPSVPSACWHQVMARIDERRRSEIRRLRAAGNRLGMRQLAHGMGVTVASDPHVPKVEIFIAGVLITVTAMLWPEALVLAIGMVGFRMARKRLRAVDCWWDEASTSIIKPSVNRGSSKYLEPDSWLQKMRRESEQL